MERISNNMNYLFQNIFSQNTNHIFLIDFDYVQKKEMDKIKLYNALENVPKKNDKIKTLKIDEKVLYETLKYNDILQIKNSINELTDLNKLNKIISKLMKYQIPDSFSLSNNLTEKKLLKSYKNDGFNILIIGAGPAGLFIANYLYKYYIKISPNPIKVNILILDNKITKKNYRKPYSRKRVFAFGSTNFSYVIPRVYCLNDEKNIIHMPIATLEYMLYCNIFNKKNVNFWFDNFDFKKVKEIIKNGNFKAIFDCSGGRLKHNIIKVNKSKWIENLLKIETKLRNSVESFNVFLNYDKKNNLIKLDKRVDKVFVPHYYYVSIIILKNNFVFDSISLEIKNSQDLKLFMNYNKTFMNYNNILNFSTNVDDSNQRKFFTYILRKFKNESNLVFKIRLFQINMRHKIKISQVTKINKKEVLYIGAGDTIFHSHFARGAGINRVIDFSAKCCNLLETIMLNEK